MNYGKPGDRVLSVEDIGHNEKIVRVVNGGGELYTTIYKGDMEVASTPTVGERRMIAWWGREGWKTYGRR